MHQSKNIKIKLITMINKDEYTWLILLCAREYENQGPVVQSIVSLTSSLRVISLTVLADSIYNIMIFFAEKKCEKLLHCKSCSHFFSKKFQHLCVSLDLNFNESLTNDIVSFEKLGPVGEPQRAKPKTYRQAPNPLVKVLRNLRNLSKP